MITTEFIILELCRRRLLFTERESTDFCLPAIDRELANLLIKNKLAALAGHVTWSKINAEAELMLVAAQTTAGEAVNQLKAGMRLSQCLERAGIPVLLMRGVFAGAQLYGDPLWRKTTDVDALIPFHHRDHALDVLIQQGYTLRDPAVPRWYNRRNHYHWSLVDPNGVLVDLHWALLHRFAFEGIDYQAIFRDAQPVAWSGYTWKAPSLQHTLLIAAAHVLREWPDFPRACEQTSDPEGLLNHIAREGFLLPVMDMTAAIMRQDNHYSGLEVARTWGTIAPLAAAYGVAKSLFQVEAAVDYALLQASVRQYVEGDIAGRLRQKTPFSTWYHEPGLPGIFTRIGLPYLFPNRTTYKRHRPRWLHFVGGLFIMLAAVMENGMGMLLRK